MINFSLKTVLTCSVLVVLSACGSGGGGSGSLDSKATQTTPTQSAKNSPSVHLSGTYVDQNLGKKVIDNSGVINKLVVNGKMIELVPESISGRIVSLSDANGKRVIDNSLKYAKHGTLESKKDGVNLIFYQGQKTPVENMPQTGVARYNGNAVFSLVNEHTNKGFYQIPVSSQLDADFSKRVVTGKISSAQYRFEPVTFSGKIAGNAFDGEGTGVSRGVIASGEFYGDKAEEVAGMFSGKTINGTVLGTFGGQR